MAAVMTVFVMDVSAARAAPFGFVGMNAEDVYAGDDAYQEQMLSQMQREGITLLRQNFHWNHSEPQRDVYDFSQLDRFVLAAARQGIRVLPLLYGETAWATSRPSGHEDDNCTYPPRDNGDFAAWAQRIVQRYGRGGILWQDNPSLAGQAVTAYEIWNEPNLKRFWACKPNAWAYVSLARAAAGAIRRADPNASIISGGAPKVSEHPGEYLHDMFAAGARTVFDTLGLHPYEPGTNDVLADLHDARDWLDDHNAQEWALVVTEFGWGTAGPPTKGKTYSEGMAAILIFHTMSVMGAQRHALKLRSASYYAWRDAPPDAGQKNYWGLYTGMLRGDLSAKPMLGAFAQAGRGL
jgi:hypothetical protein